MMHFLLADVGTNRLVLKVAARPQEGPIGSRFSKEMPPATGILSARLRGFENKLFIPASNLVENQP